ncbi:hypothetical protein GF325_08655 [Candidatus Bathyarchaeota archaeon]|nr:hypothetical protein [Candidatus Bathyarchaeota archaeon]
MSFNVDYYAGVKFSCGNKKCYGMLVPTNIQKPADGSADKIFVIGRCPDCHKSYRFPLSMKREEVLKWRPILNDQMGKCSYCGANDSLKIVTTSVNSKNQSEMSIMCSKCEKKQKRVVAPELLYLVEENLPEEDESLFSCPNCGKKVRVDLITCPHCGQEMKCDKCGGTLHPTARFCSKCGNPVKAGKKNMKIMTPHDDDAIVCPKCGNLLTEEHRFCNECGQEIVCDKCGEMLVPGAMYCNACGDRVRQGKPSA